MKAQITRAVRAKATPAAPRHRRSISLKELRRRTDIPSWVKLEMLGFFDGTHDLDHPSAACWAALEEAGIECVRVR